MSERVATIIGAGLGGLATAVRLSALGWRVHVLEQNHLPGGKLNRFESKGFVFDTGPSLLTLPELFQELLELVNINFFEELTPQRIDPLFNYRFADGSQFVYGSSIPKLVQEIKSMTGSERDVDGFLNFLDLGRRIFELSEQTFFKKVPFQSASLADLIALFRSPKQRAWGNYAKTVDYYFKDSRLKQVFNRYPTYVGSSPYESPAILSVIPYLEMREGGWYVPGGLYEIVQILIKNLPKNVHIHTGWKATKIAQSNKKWFVYGQQGEKIESDVLISNADPEEIWDISDGNLGHKHNPRNLSLSGFVALLGSRNRLPESFHHSVAFSSDYKKEFNTLFKSRKFPEDPTVYINIPSISDPGISTDAEKNGIFVMANAPPIGNDWTDEDTEFALNRIRTRLDKSGLNEIFDRAEILSHWTPRTFQNAYSSPSGAIYGQVSHGWRNSFLRPRMRQSKQPPFYFVGGGTHPGGGTSTVLMSAKIVTKLITDDHD